MDSVLNFAHSAIKSKKGLFKTCIDATCGNGFDTYFLAGLFEAVYAFDIQEIAINNTKIKTKQYSNIEFINDTFENFLNYCSKPLDCCMFNLGYLPNAVHNITTKVENIKVALPLFLNSLNLNGIISIISYPGCSSGLLEYQYLDEFLKTLNQKEFSVLKYQFINQKNMPPILFLIERIKYGN